MEQDHRCVEMLREFSSCGLQVVSDDVFGPGYDLQEVESILHGQRPQEILRDKKFPAGVV